MKAKLNYKNDNTNSYIYYTIDLNNSIIKENEEYNIKYGDNNLFISNRSIREDIFKIAYEAHCKTTDDYLDGYMDIVIENFDELKDYETLLNYSYQLISCYIYKLISIGYVNYSVLVDEDFDVNFKIDYLRDLDTLTFACYEIIAKLITIDDQSKLTYKYKIKNNNLDILNDYIYELENIISSINNVMNVVKYHYKKLLKNDEFLDKLNDLNEQWEEKNYEMIFNYEYEIMRNFDIEEIYEISDLLYKTISRNDLYKEVYHNT